MGQFRLPLGIPCRLLIKSMFVTCLLISPCVFAAELAGIAPSAGLFYQDQTGSKHRVPQLSSLVEMQVNGLINRVTVTQVFENNSEQWLNATYLFPLPDNAAVDHLRMTIAQQVIVGVIKENSVAQQIFAKAKKEGKKASLITQRRHDIFSSAVANIAPGEKVQIEIEYQQSITYKEGVFSLYFPLAITPRYAPPMARLTQTQRDDYLSCLAAEKSSEQQESWCEKRWDEWLRGVENQQLAQQTSMMVKEKNDPELQVQINVYLHSPLAVKNINSAYHKIKIEKKSTALQLISLQEGAVVADRDFVLSWQLAQGEKVTSALFVQQSDAAQYAALMLLPPAEKFSESARINKEVIFVIDVSGSMSGTSIKQAKSALNFAIEQLAENDTFNIIAFSDHSEFFAVNSLPVDKRSKAMAKVFIEQLQASGGTNMQAALQAALVGNRMVHANKKQALRQIVLITDASISNEQQLLTQIKEQLGKSRLFMVAIGSAPNHYFMKASVNLGKGTYTNIGDVNEVERKMSALFRLLAKPVLRDIKISWADGSELEHWPKPVTDLYQGEPLQLLFKIPPEKRALHISGLRFAENRAEPWSQEIRLLQPENAQGVAVLWAKAQIDSLDLNRELSEVEKQQKITALGLAFHLVTEHTSLVAVQQKTARPLMRDAIDKQVKTHLPQGNTMRLPQTGLASELYKQLGLLLLLLAGLLWVFELYYQTLNNND